VNRIRTRLVLAFLVATIVPLIATLWIMTSLLEQSLGFATTEQLDRLSTSLQETGRHYYQQARENLRTLAETNSLSHKTFSLGERTTWPEGVGDFWDSSEPERFAIAGPAGSRLDYFLRHGDEVWMYSRDLDNVRMDELSNQYREARRLVQLAEERDLRRGFTTTLLVLVISVWLVSFVWMIYLANRVSRPIQQLTAGMAQLAAGDLDTRIESTSDDEVGRAIQAFNRTAAELKQNRERLVYLTQIASWQALARKMAHELKNSLTPIRLTVEEILARQPSSDRPFMEEAVRIVVSEVEALERRVRAFSDFSSEPALHLTALDVNEAIQERVSLLKTAHANVRYTLDLDLSIPDARGDADRVKGILTNLLENAAEATGAAGEIVIRSRTDAANVCVEVHDSGPGLSADARQTLFEPTITFKERGMGLGLSIARKDALLCGGDLMLMDGKLGGAAFQLTLPVDNGTRA